MRKRTLIIAAAAALLLVACGSSAAAPTATSAPTTSSRPASPAVLRVASPTENQVVTGGVVHVAVSLAGARVVQQTSTNIRPDEGHVHLYLDNNLIYMQYSLEQDEPVHPGVYTLKAEFVASDHAPFSPRVWSQEVHFTVQ